MTAENTAMAVPNGKYVDKKLFDLLGEYGKPKAKEPTAEEIIEKMKAKMNNEPV